MKKFFYRVQDGENVFAIARKFGVPIFKIIALNALTYDVCAGDIIYIESVVGKKYNVQPFDSLESVLQKFSLSKEDFVAKNGDVIYIFYGMKIII